MYDFLYNLDVSLFRFINQTISNPIFDKFFPFITNIKHWYIAFILLWFIAIFKGGRLGKIAAFGTIFLIIVSDQISSHILKPFIERLRPCNTLQDVRLLVGCSHSYSMPSSHAVNNFAVALFWGRLFPKLKIFLYVTASLVALSRPIVGVHYFSDIFVGAIIGSIIGYLFSVLALKTDMYLKNKLERKNEN